MKLALVAILVLVPFGVYQVYLANARVHAEHLADIAR